MDPSLKETFVGVSVSVNVVKMNPSLQETCVGVSVSVVNWNHNFKQLVMGLLMSL